MKVQIALHLHMPGGQIMGVSCATPGVELDVIMLDQNLQVCGATREGEGELPLEEVSRRMQERARESGFLREDEAEDSPMKGALRDLLTKTLN